MLTRDVLLGEGHPDREFWHRVWDRRGVGEYPCTTCEGLGTRAYGSTATWRGCAAGQMVTTDVCDRCWGSGDAVRKGANLRTMESMLRQAQGGPDAR